MEFSDQVKSNIAELEQAILAAHPQLPTLLQRIHKQLKEDPNVVTLLDEDEIGTIVQGLIMHTNTQIGAATAAKKKSATKVAASMTADDF